MAQLALLGLLFLIIITTQGTPSIELSSSVNVTSGGDVCPSVTVNFTCIAIEVAFLNWFRNKMKIGDFDVGEAEKQTEIPPYILILESVSHSADPTSVIGNITSRLVVNLSDLMSGENISCSQQTAESSVVLSYHTRDPPPTPSGYIISFGEAAGATATMSFNFTWDSSFNSRHAITSYRVVPTNNEGSFVVECPSSCLPDVPCRCLGLPVGDQVQVNISAINCDDQEGPLRMVTVASSCEASDLGEADNTTNVKCGTQSSSVSITNGVGCYSSLIVGSLANYQCDEGYSLSGDSQRTCQSNGSWNGSVPQCKVYITDANIGFLASSILLWVLSVVLTIIGTVTMVIRKVSFTWQHKVYIILLVIEVLILLTVSILWGVFGAAVGNPNRVARALQNTTIIAAFALSLMAIIWIITAVVFVHLKKIRDSCVTKGGPDVDEDAYNQNRTDRSENVYDKLSYPGDNLTSKDAQPSGSDEYQLDLHVKLKDKHPMEDNCDVLRTVDQDQL